MDRSKEYRRALLVKRLEKARMAEDMQFNPKKYITDELFMIGG